MEFVASSEKSIGADDEENIWISASDGDIARVRRLVVEGTSVDTQDSSGYSPMWEDNSSWMYFR